MFDTVCAYQVEKNDILVVDDLIIGTVLWVEDHDDVIVLVVEDEEYTRTEHPFWPFSPVTLWVEESESLDDVFIEVE